jgi:hypothetical protein
MRQNDRMTDQRAQAGTARVVVKTFAPMVKIQKNMWLEWARIAIVHQQLAARHRRIAAAKGPGWGEALADEMRAGMVTIVAAAASLEALWNYLGPELMPEQYQEAEKARLDRTLPAPTPVATSVARLLIVCLGTERVPRRLRGQLTKLFELRNSAVHPPRIDDVPVLIPELETSVGAEIVMYGLEAATKYADVLMNVWSMLLGEEVSGPAKKWATANSGALRTLLALRREGQAEAATGT